MSYKYDSLSTLDRSTSSFLGIQEASSSVDLTEHVFQMANRSRNTMNLKSFSKQADFLVYSQKLEQDIKRASTTLSKLKELTCKTTRFNTEDAKINDLTISIKESISDIQNKINHLQNNNDLISSKQAEKLSKNILEVLNLRFMELTKGFKNILETRTKVIYCEDPYHKILKAIKQYQEKDSSFFSREGPSSELRNRKKQAAFLKKDKAYDPEENVSGHNGDYPGTSASMVQESQNIEALKRRQESARSIHKTLEEVMSIFQRISTMVQMHEVMIERIDKDTDDSLRHVESGRKNLVKVYKDVSGMRRMIVSIFIFLMIFAAVYVLII